MAEPRPIPVPNNEQLEELTRLRIRATQRGQRSEWIDETFAGAINHVEAAMAGIETCYQMLVGTKDRLIRLRRQLLRQLASEEEEDERLERELWENVC